MQAIPDLSACERNQFVVDANLLTGYDQAARLCGAERVEVGSIEELEATLGSGRVAFVLLLADRFAPEPVPWLTLAEVAPLAHANGAAVLVDAAADFPVVPNPYLALGADLVAHSCGKILRWASVCPVRFPLCTYEVSYRETLVVMVVAPKAEACFLAKLRWSEQRRRTARPITPLGARSKSGGRSVWVW
jgi:hypothetical protein